MDSDKLRNLFFREFFILLLCCGYSWMHNVERRADGMGDIFAKNWPSLNLTIEQCDLDVSGSGHANNLNETFCNCNWGETFFVSLSRRPKCMKGWGQNQTEDLGCKFFFKDNIYVLALTIDKSKETIGQVMFVRSDGRKSHLTSYSLNKTSLWNVTWQQPHENLFDLNAIGSLRWNSGSHVSRSQRYSGALFKFDVVANDTETGKFQSSCLLLKIAGVRKYPLVLPKIEPESSILTPIQLSSHPFASTATETISSIALPKLKTTNFVASSHSRTTTFIATNKTTTTAFTITIPQVKTRSIITAFPAEMSSSIFVSSKMEPIITSSFTAKQSTSLLDASKFHSVSKILAESSQSTKIISSKSNHIESSSTFLIQPTNATRSSSFSTVPTSTVWKNTDNTKFQKGNRDIMAPLIVGILSPSLFILLILLCLLVIYKKLTSKNRAGIMQGSSGTTDEISMKQMPNSQKQYVQSWCDKHMNEPNVKEGEGSRSTQSSNQANVGDGTTNGGPSKIDENINQNNDHNDNHNHKTVGDSCNNQQQICSILPEGPSKDLPSTKAAVEPLRPSMKLPPLLVKPVIANQPVAESSHSCLDDCSPIAPINVSQGTSNLSGLPTSRPKLPPLERTNKSKVLPNVDIDG